MQYSQVPKTPIPEPEVSIRPEENPWKEKMISQKKQYNGMKFQKDQNELTKLQKILENKEKIPMLDYLEFLKNS